MRVKIYLLIGAVCVSALLFSCNRRGGQPARKLLIYTPHGQDLLKDFIGSVHGTGENVSEDGGEKFSDYLVAKKREGRL